MADCDKGQPLLVEFYQKRKRGQPPIKATLGVTTRSKSRKLSENDLPNNPRNKVARNLISKFNQVSDQEDENLVTKSANVQPLLAPLFSPAKTSPLISPTSSLTKAKRLLSVSTLESIIGRDKEREEIRSFLDHHLSKKKSSSFYVSGPPGTGKTISLISIINELSKTYNFTRLIYNLMDFHPCKAIYDRIAGDLGTDKTDKRHNKNLVGSIERLIASSENMVVLLLDEIDTLLTKDADLLYTIFDWPRLKNSKLILIGVANTYDFTERSLSRLAVFGGKLVQQISFKPYQQSDLENIIKSRLGPLKEELFSEQAIQLCSKMVAVQHRGDARKALDFCRRALEMAEREAKSKMELSPLKSISDDRCNPGSPKKSPRKKTMKTIMVQPTHVATIVGQAYGKAIDIENLTTQQRTILCILIVNSQKKKTKELEIAACHQIYVKTNQVKGLFSASISFPDFLSMCQLLEARELVRIRESKEIKKSKMCLAVNEDNLSELLRDLPFTVPLMVKLNSML